MALGSGDVDAFDESVSAAGISHPLTESVNACSRYAAGEVETIMQSF